jgi:tetratricopeptide (TPR) repeat protein
MAQLIAILGLAVVPLVASAADPWTGQKVFTKIDAQPKVGSKKVDISVIPMISVVQNVNGDWLWLGSAWVRKSDVYRSDREALNGDSEWIRKHPSDPKGWNHRGVVWHERGDYDKAINDFTEAIRLQPNHHAYTNRGRAWTAKREYGLALDDYDAALLLDPNNAVALNNAAWLRATCPEREYRDGTRAVEHANAACALSDWKSSPDLDTLAAAYAESGDYQNASKWQQKALELMTNQSEIVSAKRRLELYKARRPYREEPQG